MEGSQNSDNKLSRFSRALTLAFAISLLLSIYFLFTLPSDLRIKGNLQYMDLVAPILVRLYLALFATIALACVALYAEMKNIKVAIVYKEKSAAQVAEEKSQSEFISQDALDSKSITAKDTKAILTDSLNALVNRFSAGSGACYITGLESDTKFAELVSGYALPLTESEVLRYNFGEGLIGQVAKTGAPIYLDEIPEGYVPVESGLGKASPRHIFIFPLKKNDEVKGILEIATFKAISQQEKQMAEKFSGEIGERLS